MLDCFDYLIKHKSHATRKYNYEMIIVLVEFQINNDMRIGELLAIKTDNVNIENKTLEIYNHVTNKMAKDMMNILERMYI